MLMEAKCSCGTHVEKNVKGFFLYTKTTMAGCPNCFEELRLNISPSTGLDLDEWFKRQEMYDEDIWLVPPIKEPDPLPRNEKIWRFLDEE